MQLLQIIALTTVSGLFSLIGAFILSRKKQWSNTALLHLTALSSGVLLATALFNLAPEALHELSSDATFLVIALAIIAFFILEKFVVWHHHHADGEHCGPKPSSIFIMVGDSIHNFIDGVLIAGAFSVSPELGVVTAIAVAAHEIPQEIADFSVMVAGGMSRKQALMLNAISALFAVLGGVFGYLFVAITAVSVPYLLAFCAGMFLYIALSDLIPELHAHSQNTQQKITQVALFLIGIATIFTISQFLGHSHELDDDHGHEVERFDDHSEDHLEEFGVEDDH